MSKYILITATALFISFSAYANSFVEGLEDIPVPSGMTQLQSDTISFGNEESRLVEALLTSHRIGYKSVISFYQKTLPQMGWVYQGSREQTLVFDREGEVLEIARESDNPLVIRLTVKSKI